MAKAGIEALPDTEEQDVILFLVPRESFEKMTEIASLRGISVADAIDEAMREYSQKHKEQSWEK